MTETNNVSSEITHYIKEKDGEVTANEIYAHFKGGKYKYTHGQISGALNRLKQSGRIVSPKRGVYENTNSSNVLQEMEQDIKQLIEKYNNSIPITIYNALNKNDKEKYTNVLSTLQNLI